MMFLLSRVTMTGGCTLQDSRGRGNIEIRIVIWHSGALHEPHSGGRLNKVIRRAIGSRTRAGRAHVRLVSQ